MTSSALIALPPLTPETADAASADLLGEARKRMGFVPNMYARMAHSHGLLETYIRGQALFRQESGLSPAEQEVVFLAISRENECTYCVAAHSFLAGAVSKVPPDVTQALRDGRPVPDTRLAALAAFTRTLVTSRGFPLRPAVAAFLAAGFNERHVLEIVLAIGLKTMSNYANHLLATPIDERFAGHEWPSM